MNVCSYGGIGIGNAVSGFVASKTTTIATLKCLGASTRVIDRATFEQPATPADGIAYVLVNGTPVWQHGAHTGARPGRALRRPAADVAVIDRIRVGTVGAVFGKCPGVAP